MAIAVYPGSFDPITFGHIDIATRAAKLFETVHVLVVHNPGKNPKLSLDKRVELVKAVLANQPGNFVVSSLASGLLVDYCKEVKAEALVKGIRTNVDIDYELPMAQVNRDLSGIETVFLPADPAHGFISSSLVKQVASLGGDISKYVPAEVVEALKN
ncbi:MAG: pantetheine-phosphate adenylyltransferase [Micrococcales bacterium]|jgi:pantetheine-phosphate adenylyltransferase|nr:pantetheine-phosphate adenylyltransferase [Micrococcales bacterium]NBS61491.1 pantetheine-phosphate adenylyltransferase [Microbacteriaceae bacterium]NBX94117.1 pantetheine-phosphate adenylyltransferase [Actinomycetota bacterium]